MTKVTGSNTQFKKQFEVGDGLVASIGPKFTIEEILSDTEMRIKTFEKDESVLGQKELKYKIHPKIDQTEVFTNVYDAFNNGQCIGIFPEGGSHDQTKLLPLKPGVAIMALGAMLKYPEIKINVVGCGLKYFKP